MRILACFLANQIRIQALKMALIGATIIMLAVGSSMAATITVHSPDGEDRVFVDVVGRIENGDFETFKQKTDQIEASHPEKLVIVTLMSYGGAIHPAIQIGELVRKRRMLTFVPGDHTCASACALIWVSGWLRTVGDTPQIGFHAAYDKDTQRETGAANALVGAYLRDLEFSYKAIHFMTRKGPTDLEWLTPDLAKEVGGPLVHASAAESNSPTATTARPTAASPGYCGMVQGDAAARDRLTRTLHRRLIAESAGRAAARTRRDHPLTAAHDRLIWTGDVVSLSGTAGRGPRPWAGDSGRLPSALAYALARSVPTAHCARATRCGDPGCWGPSRGCSAARDRTLQRVTRRPQRSKASF